MEEEKDNKISVGKTVNINAAASVYNLPTFATSYNGRFIKWLDSDNVSQWPDKLLEYKSSSALHGRITRGIIRQVIGAGFTYDTSLGQQSTATEAFLKKENKDGDNLFQIWSKFVDDEYTFGPAALVLVYEKSKASILSVEHINMRQIRAVPVVDKKIPGWIWSWDWNKQQKNDEWLYIPSNDFLNAKASADGVKKAIVDAETAMKNMQVDDVKKSLKAIDDIYGTTNVTVLVHMPTRDTVSFYYPSWPTYIGGLTSIRSDIKASEYNLNALSNGLNIDSILMIYGINSTEGKEVFCNDFNAQIRNPDRGKGTLFLFPPDEQHKPDFEALNSNSEAMLYSKINLDLTDKILQAHGITVPSLVGVSKSSIFGDSGDALIQGAQLFYEETILPLQMKCIEPINKIMLYNGLCPLTVDRLKSSLQTQITKPTN